MVDLLGALPGIRGEGADVPVPYLASRRSRRGADSRLRNPGWCTAEDGYVRIPAVLDATAAQRSERSHRRDGCCGPINDRDCLRGAGQPDAEGLEEASGLLVGKPYGLLHSG